jgi:hypothetical protein
MSQIYANNLKMDFSALVAWAAEALERGKHINGRNKAETDRLGGSVRRSNGMRALLRRVRSKGFVTRLYDMQSLYESMCALIRTAGTLHTGGSVELRKNSFRLIVAREEYECALCAMQMYITKSSDATRAPAADDGGEMGRMQRGRGGAHTRNS